MDASPARRGSSGALKAVLLLAGVAILIPVLWFGFVLFRTFFGSDDHEQRRWERQQTQMANAKRAQHATDLLAKARQAAREGRLEEAVKLATESQAERADANTARFLAELEEIRREQAADRPPAGPEDLGPFLAKLGDFRDRPDTGGQDVTKQRNVWWRGWVRDHAWRFKDWAAVVESVEPSGMVVFRMGSEGGFTVLLLARGLDPDVVTKTVPPGKRVRVTGTFTSMHLAAAGFRDFTNAIKQPEIEVAVGSIQGE